MATIAEALAQALEHYQAGEVAQAEQLYARILQANPAEAYYHLGLLLAGRNLRDEAIACYEQALRARPVYPEALNNLANFYKDQGRLEEALACYRRALAARPGDPLIQGNLLFVLHYPASYDPQTTFAEHLRWGAQLANTPHLSLEPIDREATRRLRIGYVSPDFRECVMGRYLEAVIAAHDRTQVEVFCYGNISIEDARTQRVKSSADRYRSIAAMSDLEVAEAIRRDRIDLLIDLAGHTRDNRLPVFAHKPAPIQVSHFGYPASTGLPAMDYRITDAYCDPPGQTEHLHCEKLVRLPGIQWCYVPWSSPEIKPLPASASGKVTFGSLNTLAKVTDEVIGWWAKILRRLPASRLLMVAGVGKGGDERVRTAFARHAIESTRIQLVGRQPLESYYRLIQDMDIVLDAYPVTGCNTTADALWMGVPVVTRVGPTWVTRQGLAILSQVDLEDLAVHTPGEYIDIVVRLACDLPRLRELRAQLRERLQHSLLMDIRGFTHNLEAAYRQLWKTFCDEV
jgi:predicted O-linked N-acetylglucosamine transferase (SPINDLY family)